jgi:hypothetical protein
VFGVEDRPPERRQGGVSSDARHVRPGDHDLSDDRVVELEHALDHLDFGGVDVAGLDGPGQDSPDLPLFEGLVGLGGRGHPEQSRERVGGPVEHHVLGANR